MFTMLINIKPHLQLDFTSSNCSQVFIKSQFLELNIFACLFHLTKNFNKQLRKLQQNVLCCLTTNIPG